MKTWLTPDEQWRRTVALAEAYASAVSELLSDAPPYPGDGHGHFSDWVGFFRDVKVAWAADPRAARFAELGGYDGVEIFQRSTWRIGDPWRIARIRRTHLLFAVGDVVLVAITNGQRRQPVWGVTSRGYPVRGYHLETDRDGRERGAMVSFPRGFPSEPVGRRLADPGAQRYVEGLRAGWPAAR